MRNATIRLVTFNEHYLEEIWRQGFQEAAPEWKQWDGPYFDDDYQMFETFEAFKQSSEYDFFMNERRRCILADELPVGMVTMFWEDKKTRWLDIGITIYDPKYWSGGIGTQAIRLWLDEIFETYQELEHIGLVTWSGNFRMMKAAEKVGMQQEARIRKVRYWNGIYYDSLSYGILREEWAEIDRCQSLEHETDS